MIYPSQEEINLLANKYIELRDKKPNSKEFKDHQQLCISKFKYLVLSRTYKYKKFSNYPDLEQDGFEALLLALRTYNSKKGSFSWWADKYICTRITRAANAHSTIKYPIKYAKTNRPYKVDISDPWVYEKDSSLPSVHDIMDDMEENNSIHMAIDKLPEQHKKVIIMMYGFNGSKRCSVDNLIKKLSLTKPQINKILREAKNQLKDMIGSYEI